MTLLEWSAKYGVAIEIHGSGARFVTIDIMRRTARMELYHLTDYKVSTVGGMVIWLNPVREVKQ